jgi:hypothetical protein
LVNFTFTALKIAANAIIPERMKIQYTAQKISKGRNHQ